MKHILRLRQRIYGGVVQVHLDPGARISVAVYGHQERLRVLLSGERLQIAIQRCHGRGIDLAPLIYRVNDDLLLRNAGVGCFQLRHKVRLRCWTAVVQIECDQDTCPGLIWQKLRLNLLARLVGHERLVEEMVKSLQVDIGQIFGHAAQDVFCRLLVEGIFCGARLLVRWLEGKTDQLLPARFLPILAELKSRLVVREPGRVKGIPIPWPRAKCWRNPLVKPAQVKQLFFFAVPVLFQKGGEG